MSFTILHPTTLHFTILHPTTLHYTSLYFTQLHFTALHYTSPKHTSLHFTILTQLHFTELHYTSPNYSSLHVTILHPTTLYYISLYFTQPHFTALHYTYPTTLHYSLNCLNPIDISYQLHVFQHYHSQQLHAKVSVSHSGVCGCFRELTYQVMSMSTGARCWWRIWLRRCATSRKVAGSIPNGVFRIFHWHNPFGRTMALGSTQPLTETSTSNISWVVKAVST